MTKLKRVLLMSAYIIALLMAMFMLYEGIILVKCGNGPAYEVKGYQGELVLEYDIRNCPYNKPQIKIQVDNLFNNPFYFYNEVDDFGYDGLTTFVIRKIEIRTALPLAEYTYVMAHELVHLTEYTMNECYTTYKSIILLYESNNAWFKEVAKYKASEIVENHNKGVYDCGYYLLEYFGGGIK